MGSNGLQSNALLWCVTFRSN